MTNDEDNGVFGWRITQLENTVKALDEKFDKVMWSLIIAALSFAGSVAVFALTVFTAR